MAMYFNCKKVRNLYYNGKCITRLAEGKGMTRLVEGDDFVRAEWLVAEVSTSAEMMLLPINSNTISFRHIRIGGINYHYFHTSGYSYYYANTYQGIAIWGGVQGQQLFTANLGTDDIQINTSNSAIKVNAVDVPIYNYPITEVCIIARNSNGLKTKTSTITVDGIERYIPCRLLRPLPSYLDANGKARSQFECGMIDLKTMKFYGNVAATGNFTVSDN